MTPRRLATVADILAAAHWRLRDWPAERIEAGLQLVAGLATPISEDVPEVDKAMASVEDGRDPWGGLCALLVLSANAAGDMALLFAAGYAVLDARRQAEKSEGRRGGDALDGLIRSMIAELPSWTPVMLWAELVRRASSGSDAVLADYDCLRDAVAYEPQPRAPLREIGRAAYIRRLQRIKKTARQTPEYDSPRTAALSHQ